MTNEEALENALFQIFQTPIRLQAASRTDAGVHAYGQVVNFFIDDEVLKSTGERTSKIMKFIVFLDLYFLYCLN